MPNLSIWNSVDPMADKYPSLSPYNYCAWNPMKLVDPEGDSIILSKSAEAIHAKYYNKKGYEEYTNLYNKLNRDESVLFYFKEGNDNQYAKSQGSNGIIDYSETQLASYSHGCFDVEWGTPNDNYGGTIEHVYMEEFRHAGQIVEGDYKLSAASTIESEYNAKRFAIQNTRNRYSLYYDDNINHIYSIPTELYIIDTYGPERAKQYLKYGIDVDAKNRDNNVINRKEGGHYNVFPIR